MASELSALLTADEVKEALRLDNTNAVYRMARSGELPTVTIGARRIRFRAADVERYIESRLTTGPRGSRS